MKKFLLIFTSVVIILFASAYTLTFTPFGNDILKPFIQDKINASSPINLTLEKFRLNTNTIDLIIKLDASNQMTLQGSYKLFEQSFDLTYDILFHELSEIKESPLKGQFVSNGTIRGDLNSFTVDGESDFASSSTRYSALFNKRTLKQIALKSSNINIEALLQQLKEKAYAKGKADLHLQVLNMDQIDFDNPTTIPDASLIIELKQATLNTKLIQKEFGIHLAKNSLQSSIKGTLKEEKLRFKVSILSDLVSMALDGKANPLAKSIDSTYSINIKELALLQSITHKELKGPLFTQGNIQGNKALLKINGKSNIADSKATYNLSLQDLSPSKAIINISNAKLDKLLYMIGEKRMANGIINADIQFKDLINFYGDASLSIKEGTLDRGIIKKLYDVSIPKTSFYLDATTKLNKNIDYKLYLHSNLAKLSSSGQINPKSSAVNAKYLVDIKELKLLKPLTHLPIQGELGTDGTINGNTEHMTFSGRSNLADSITKYNFDFAQMSPKSGSLSIQNASLSKLLYMLDLPAYSNGKLNANVNIKSVQDRKITTLLSINQGQLNTPIIKKTFDLNLPNSDYSLHSDIQLNENLITASSQLNASIANAIMKKSTYDISTKHFNSDFSLDIPNLTLLQPLTQRNLMGSIKANGSITKDKQLRIDAHSKLFDGKIHLTMIDNQLNAELQKVRAYKVLKMLSYPEIIDAPIDGTLTYDTLAQQGELDARFDSAYLARTQLTDLIYSLTRKDLSKEQFNEGTLHSKINGPIINSELMVRSSTAEIKSKKFIFNRVSEKVDAKMHVKIKKYSGDITIKGSIHSPQVSPDVTSILESPQIKEKAVKEINKLLKKLF